jgi:hypothetical protein
VTIEEARKKRCEERVEFLIWCERSETLLEGGRGFALSLRSYSFLLFLYYLTEAFCGAKSRVCPGKNILRSPIH